MSQKRTMKDTSTNLHQRREKFAIMDYLIQRDFGVEPPASATVNRPLVSIA